MAATSAISTIPARPAIYARISDDREKDTLGVQRQIKQCRQLAHRMGWPEPAVFQDDDVSAFKKKQRLDWNRLTAAIRAGAVDGLLGVHPDRFTRSDLRDLEDLIDLLNDHHVIVETVNAGKYDLTTATGRMNARVIGSVARGESERISEKVRDKMVELREAGQHHGRSPFGYRKAGKSLEVVPEQAAVVREVAERVIDGWSLRRICTDLNDRGISTQRGTTWKPTVVRDMVLRPTVIGWRSHKGERAAQGDWEPILDERTWERAGQILTDPARKTTRPGRRYLLGGMIYTAAGEPMHGHPSRVRNTTSYVGPGTTISQVRTDEEVLKQLWEHVAQLRELPQPADDDAERARAELDGAEAELAALARRRQAREIEQVEYEVFAGPLRDRIAELRRKRVVARGPNLRSMATSPADLRAGWEDKNLSERRDILAGFIERVTIVPRTIASGFDPNRVQVSFAAAA